MARTAAIELVGHRIRVNVVHPGWINTPGERKFFTDEQMAVGGAKLPWGRLGRPEEVAKGVAFILSDDAEYMTGSTVAIDGGVSLPGGRTARGRNLIPAALDAVNRFDPWFAGGFREFLGFFGV